METCDCGHPPTETNHCGTGYGINESGQTVCYDCCAVADLGQIKSSSPGDRFVGYLSSDSKAITNWPGRVLMTSVHVGAFHPWSRERRYISAWDRLGRRWYGTGAPGMYAPLKLAK